MMILMEEIGKRLVGGRTPTVRCEYVSDHDVDDEVDNVSS